MRRTLSDSLHAAGVSQWSLLARRVPPRSGGVGHAFRWAIKRMAAKVIRLASVASCILCGVSLVLFALSFVFNPWDHRISFSEDFHLGLWRGCVVLFNDSKYGPYRGSIIGLADTDGDVFPPLEREIKWGDSLGVYFRYFRWTDATLWTLMVSLLWPLAIFGLPTAVCVCVWWRRCVVGLPTRHGRRPESTSA